MEFYTITLGTLKTLFGTVSLAFLFALPVQAMESAAAGKDVEQLSAANVAPRRDPRAQAAIEAERAHAAQVIQMHEQLFRMREELAEDEALLQVESDREAAAHQAEVDRLTAEHRAEMDRREAAHQADLARRNGWLHWFFPRD